MSDSNPFNAVVNLVTATLVVALIWAFAISGGAIALTFSKLPTVFWIAVILVILYMVLKK